MSPAHLYRYVAEFEDRQNAPQPNILEQLGSMVQGADQKQLRLSIVDGVQ